MCVVFLICLLFISAWHLTDSLFQQRVAFPSSDVCLCVLSVYKGTQMSTALSFSPWPPDRTLPAREIRDKKPLRFWFFRPRCVHLKREGNGKATGLKRNTIHNMYRSPDGIYGFWVYSFFRVVFFPYSTSCTRVYTCAHVYNMCPKVKIGRQRIIHRYYTYCTVPGRERVRA